MTIQHFTCLKCGTTLEDTVCGDTHKCPGCGSAMRWDCGGGIAPGDYNHISASLAINPCQIKAHKKLFPGIDVLPDGQIHFDSVKKQSDYCEQTGFEKMTQKIKNKGVKIA